jgi:uncharacterized membrane protein
MQWYQSKIIWFNILSAILMIADTFLSSGFIPAEYVIYFTMFVNVVNIILRTFFSSGQRIESDRYNQI